MRYYVHEEIDKMMQSPKSLPRYAHLARKALSHYLGDKYNPEEFPASVEYMFRDFIKGYVKLKVFDEEPYDWPFIDNFFRFYLANEGYDLTYDESKFMKGYNGVIRGDVPQHHC